MNLTYEQVLQLIGAKELDIAALKMKVAELQKELEALRGQQ